MPAMSTKDRMATIMVAAKVVCGSSAIRGARKSIARATPTAAKAPAAGVSAPASKLTTEREKLPVTENPQEIAAPRLAAPKPISRSEEHTSELQSRPHL